MCNAVIKCKLILTIQIVKQYKSDIFYFYASHMSCALCKFILFTLPYDLCSVHCPIVYSVICPVPSTFFHCLLCHMSCAIYMFPLLVLCLVYFLLLHCLLCSLYKVLPDSNNVLCTVQASIVHLALTSEHRIPSCTVTYVLPRHMLSLFTVHCTLMFS